MKLAELFSLYPHPRWGESANEDVSGVTSDSRNIEKGYVFVAIRGLQFDGHQALKEVCSQGVIALVVEDEKLVPSDFAGAVLLVQSTRRAYHALASRFYREPSEDMFCVGVTGTNGKSTISYMVDHLLSQFGWPTGVIGTIDHHIGDKKWKTELTTPDAQTLHKRLSEFVSVGGKAMCMEISSIGLDQERIGAISFDAVVFTNLTRDHLDYHSNMENYLTCKEKLFTEILAESKKENAFAIINEDDLYGQKLRVNPGAKTWFYGQGEKADLRFDVLEADLSGTRAMIYTPRGEGELFLPMVGLHNLYNAMAALGVALSAGVSLSHALSSFENFSGVPGRLQKISGDMKKDINVFVDYAHTNDALENLLKAFESIDRKSSRLITVFGCGGDRDTGKRPLMAQVAEEYSDHVFVTSDNPRKEDPQKIIDDIVQGFSSGACFQVVIDRKEAIEQALDLAQSGDIVVIAGKGHENYQIIGEERLPFDDFQIAEDFLAD